MATTPDCPPERPGRDVLDAIQRRVPWLPVRMVDHANRERPNLSKAKVGEHQMSSASLVSIMTALYLSHLDGFGRVAVKPHAPPVLHALNNLLGRFDRRYPTQLRTLGGLQAYPSRTKDPDPSTSRRAPSGSAPSPPSSWRSPGSTSPTTAGRRAGVASSRSSVTPSSTRAMSGRRSPSTPRGLGNVLWVVDVNRQSLDRVVPGIKAVQLKRLFDSSGWRVVEAKVPAGSGFRAGAKPLATQEAFGRIMTALARNERVAERLVTASPDVALSTNLGWWIDRVGASDRRGEDVVGGGDGGLLRWDESTKGSAASSARLWSPPGHRRLRPVRRSRRRLRRLRRDVGRRRQRSAAGARGCHGA